MEQLVKAKPVLVDGAPVHYDSLPPVSVWVKDAIENYIERGYPAGSGVMSIIENAPVKDVLSRIDQNVTENLRELLIWFNCSAPGECWGSKEAVHEWMANRQRENYQP